MKRIAVCFLACVISLLAIPAAGPQARLDVGAIVATQLDIDLRNVDDDDSLDRNGFLQHVITLPAFEGDLYYQRVFGSYTCGVGARVFTLFAETLAWPDAFVELDLRRVVIEAQAGAGAFTMFGILSRSAFGSVFIPDLSAWVKTGRTGDFRVGGGLMGLYVPGALGDSMAFLLHVGGKFSLLP